MKNSTLLFISGIVLVLASCTSKQVELEEVNVALCDTLVVTYAIDIQPMIDLNCGGSGCHGQNGNFGDMSTHDLLSPYVSAGKITTRVIENKTMPPSAPLSDSDIEMLNCWIENGALNN